MIYVFPDGSYQSFPKPKAEGPDARRFIQVSGETEQRILAGEPYRMDDYGNAVVFLEPDEVAAEALAEAKTAKRRDIDAWRKDAERAGFVHQFPDNTSGTVQLRNSDDKANITGLAVAAQANSGGVFQFRDGEDVSHSMTSADVIALGNATQAFISGNYQQAWALKAQVEAATTVAQLDSITWE